MKLLLLTMHWDYGKREQGESIEHWNFYRPLSRLLGGDLAHYDYVDRTNLLGRDRMERELSLMVFGGGYDNLLIVPYDAAHNPSPMTWGAIKLNAPHMNLWMWSPDSTWRYYELDKPRAQVFDKVVSTSRLAKTWYERDSIGHKYIHCQWAANAEDYRRSMPWEERDLDVAFIGGWHGGRKELLAPLIGSGLKVAIAGCGQPLGHVDFDGMVRLMNRAKIVLNFNGSSQPGPPQLKLRVFEAAACGAAVCTQEHPELGEYFCVADKGREIITFPEGPGRMMPALQEWLSRSQRLADVAERGYQRVLAEHTWERRFADLFSRLAP